MNAPESGLVVRCERAEAAADEARARVMPAEAGERLGGGCRRIGDALLLYATRADILQFNRVIGLGIERPTTESQLDDVVAAYDALGVPRFMVHVAPGARPAEFTGWLEARGFHEHGYWIRLARDASPAPPVASDLTIAPLGRDRALEAGALVAEAFGFPDALGRWMAAVVGRDGWQMYGAFDGETLAGVGGFYVHGDAAWLGMAATRASHRGRGGQSALIARRIDEARALGCRWLTTETAADTPEKPNPSTHNMRRLGFRDAYRRPNWLKVLRTS